MTQLIFQVQGVIARLGARLLGMQATPSLTPASGVYFQDLVIKYFYDHFSCSAEQLSVTVFLKSCLKNDH